MHTQIHATEHDQERPEGNATEQQRARHWKRQWPMQCQIEPDIPGDVNTEKSMVRRKAPVLTVLQGDNGGDRRPGQAQHILQETWRSDSVKGHTIYQTTLFE